MKKYTLILGFIVLALIHIPVSKASTETGFYGNQSLTPLIESGTEYIPLPGSVRLEIDNGKDTYFSTDHLGSTRVEISADNSAQGQVEYTPFGENKVTRNISTSRQYTGQEFENETQTYNYHARQFDANVGRFLSLDTRRQTASPYAYVGSNPINFVDHNGSIIELFTLTPAQSAILAEYRGRISKYIENEKGLPLTDKTQFNQSIQNVVRAGNDFDNIDESDVEIVKKYTLDYFTKHAGLNPSDPYLSTINSIGSFDANQFNGFLLGLVDENDIVFDPQKNASKSPLTSLAARDDINFATFFHLANHSKGEYVGGSNVEFVDTAFLNTLDYFIDHGKKIGFNLDGFDVQRALYDYETTLNNGVDINDSENFDGITNFEFNTLIRNKTYFDNTVFFKKGQQLKSHELPALGIHPLFE